METSLSSIGKKSTMQIYKLSTELFIERYGKDKDWLAERRTI